MADANLVYDDFLQNSAQNQAFISNLVDWVAADEMLVTIPQRTGGRAVFKFSDPSQVKIVQYSSLIVPPLLVTGFGLLWLGRRRKMARREWGGIS